MGSNKIFITGATGHLGSRILKELLAYTKNEIVLLMRGENFLVRKNRLLKSISRDQGEARRFSERIRMVPGDVTLDNLGLDSNDRKYLQSQVGTIFHCAALTGFRLTFEQAKTTNIGGTSRIIEFARGCRNPPHVNYISTLFIAGRYSGFFFEKTNLKNFKKFNNLYEESKYFVEKIVLAEMAKKRMSISIFRPGMISGEYQTGVTSNFKIFYEPIRFFSSQIFDAVPLDIKVPHNLVPVDVAARAIYLLSTRRKGDIYHIICPNFRTLGHFFDLASVFFGFQNPQFVPEKDFDFSRLSAVQRRILDPFIPYFNYKARFQCERTVGALKELGFQYPELDDQFLARLFDYCQRKRFIKVRENHHGSSI